MSSKRIPAYFTAESLAVCAALQAPGDKSLSEAVNACIDMAGALLSHGELNLEPEELLLICEAVQEVPEPIAMLERGQNSSTGMTEAIKGLLAGVDIARGAPAVVRQAEQLSGLDALNIYGALLSHRHGVRLGKMREPEAFESGLEWASQWCRPESRGKNADN